MLWINVAGNNQCTVTPCHYWWTPAKVTLGYRNYYSASHHFAMVKWWSSIEDRSQDGKWCWCCLAEAVWLLWVGDDMMTPHPIHLNVYQLLSQVWSIDPLLCPRMLNADYFSAGARPGDGVFTKFNYLWSNLKTIFPEMKSLVFAIEIVVIFHIQ